MSQQPASIVPGCADADLVVSVWFERDRKHLSLSTPQGHSVVDLWDDEIDQLVEDGFLTVPRHPRPSENDWRSHLLAYAQQR
jgi:hypothetical protein